MAWKCPTCKCINHSSPSRCSCGQRVRSSSTSYTSRPTDDGLDLIDVIIIADMMDSNSTTSNYVPQSSYDSPSYSSSDSYSSSSDSGSSSCD